MNDERAIVDWQTRQFPDATPRSIFKHFCEEVSELDYEIDHCDGENKDDVHGEIGDLGLLLVSLAHKYGTTLETCIHDKFLTASVRKYAYDPILGYARHVDETCAGCNGGSMSFALKTGAYDIRLEDDSAAQQWHCSTCGKQW